MRFEPFCADPAPLYRWADVVVVPSRLPEALGRVAIEAMAHRRPPLVARIGGLPEIVEDRVSGWIVAPNDAAALARTLREIVTQAGGLARLRRRRPRALRGDIRRARDRPPVPGNRARAPDRESRSARRARSRAGVAMRRDLIRPDPQLHALARRRRDAERLSLRPQSHPDPAAQRVRFRHLRHRVRARRHRAELRQRARLRAGGGAHAAAEKPGRDELPGRRVRLDRARLRAADRRAWWRSACSSRSGTASRRLAGGAFVGSWMLRYHVRTAMFARRAIGRGDAVGYQLHGKRHRAGRGRALARSGGRARHQRAGGAGGRQPDRRSASRCARCGCASASACGPRVRRRYRRIWPDIAWSLFGATTWNVQSQGLTFLVAAIAGPAAYAPVAAGYRAVQSAAPGRRSRFINVFRADFVAALAEGRYRRLNVTIYSVCALILLSCAAAGAAIWLVWPYPRRAHLRRQVRSRRDAAGRRRCAASRR